VVGFGLGLALELGSDTCKCRLFK